MHFSLFGLIRPVAFALTGLTALAIALGRTATEGPDSRSTVPVRYRAINWYLFQKEDPTPHFIDAETGRVVGMPLGDSAYHKYLSCSPWRDARGQAQVVGMPGGHPAAEAGLAEPVITLARYTFPEGRMLDTVPLESLIPTSAPCWFPGKSLRILFGAADGRLYRLSFPGVRGTPESDHDDLLKPVPLAWEIPAPANGQIWLGDPVWPTDARLGDRLFASMTVSGRVDRDGQPSGAQLWWLQLSTDGHAIRGAGRLIDADEESTERWPAVATNAQGQVELAYLARQRGEKGWRLRLARISLDPITRAPHAKAPRAVSQRGEGLPVPPVFSADGRWIHFMAKPSGSPAEVERFDFLAWTTPAPKNGAPMQLTRGD